MDLTDCLAATGAAASLIALLVALRANAISKRAIAVAQDPTTFHWECELDEAGFPTLLRNASLTTASRVQVTIAIDGRPQGECNVANTVEAHGAIRLDLKDTKDRYLETVQRAHLAYSSTLPGPRLAAASIQIHVLVTCESPNGAMRHHEFEVHLAHAIENGRIVRELHKAIGSIIDTAAGVTRMESL